MCFFFNPAIRLNNGVQVEANKVILAAMSTFFRKELHENLTNTYDGRDKYLLTLTEVMNMLKSMNDIQVFYD